MWKKIANSTNISGVSIMWQAPGYGNEQPKQNLHLHGTSGGKMPQENKNDRSPIINTIWVLREGEPLTCFCWAVLNLLEVVLYWNPTMVILSVIFGFSFKFCVSQIFYNETVLLFNLKRERESLLRGKKPDRQEVKKVLNLGSMEGWRKHLVIGALLPLWKWGSGYQGKKKKNLFKKQHMLLSLWVTLPALLLFLSPSDIVKYSWF